MPRPEAGFEILGSQPEGDGWLLTVRLPEASPLFTGHFPGHPILPGVAHLALVTRAIADWQGRQVVLASVRSWKLRRPAEPGETLAVRLSAASDGGVGFTLEKDGEGETVSRGIVSWR
jgi:3-hydroxyacyl-[acyl-carrier-protein] dehydratase